PPHSAPSTPSLHDALPILPPSGTPAARAMGRANVACNTAVREVEFIRPGNKPARRVDLPARQPSRRPTSAASARPVTEDRAHDRSEEHTSELQSPDHLVCR